MRRIRICSAVAVLCLWGLARAAMAETIEAEHAELVATLSPDEGFIDDPFAFDHAGSRLLYVNSDTGTSATVVVVDALQRTELMRVSLKAFTLRPSKVEFALDGEHFVVWTEDSKTGRKRVALIDKKGKVIRKFGPALDIVRSNYEGNDALVVHDVGAIKSRKKASAGEEPVVVRHSVAVYSLANGKLIGKKSNLDLDATDRSPELDFTLKYWIEDFTIAVGIKGGAWDAKEDQRSPDFEGWYVMPTQTFAKRLPIKDLVAHREHMARMVKFAKRSRDIVVRHNLSGVDFIEDGAFTSISLAEPFHHYDAQSLVTQASSEGNLFFTLTIDPVHPDAAAARRAVTPWMDLYEYNPATKKAVRRARLLPPKGRKHTWRATTNNWAIMPRHIGFDRGGTKLLLYQLDAKR